MFSTHGAGYRLPIKIEEFRTPAYAVSLNDDVMYGGARPLVVGESIEMAAEAKYYAGGGLTYTIDILRLVPYVDFSLGLLGTTREVNGERRTRNDLGVELGLGVDYLVNRTVSIGLVVRYHAMVTALSELPVYLFFGPRVAFHFGG